MFNPFSVPPGEAPSPSDIESLIGRVAEGYFVEYKAQLPHPKKIANSIASFANTYGGWYIVGITTDEDHRAQDVCGISREAQSDPVASIRDAVKNRVDPVPLLFIWPVSLRDDKVVVVVLVPDGQATPFVSNDGRVYRRNHDSSDPVPEDRRHTLDFLFEQGRRRYSRFASLWSRELEPSRLGISPEPAWLNLYLQPDPLGLIDKSSSLSGPGIDDILALSDRQRPIIHFDGGGSVSGNIVFDNAYYAGRSVRLRGLGQRFITEDHLRAELFAGGSARFHAPFWLPYLQDYSVDNMSSLEARSILEAAAVSEDARSLRVLDASSLLVTVALIVSFYHDWIGPSDQVSGFAFGFSLKGTWSTIPVVDSAGWASQAERWGLPLLDGDITEPEQPDNPIMLQGDEEGRTTFPVLRYVSASLGLDVDLYVESLWRAFQRAAGLASGDQPPDA